MKSGQDAREKALKQKQEEEKRREEAQKLEEERFLADPDIWLKEKREERAEIHARIVERKKLSGQAGNRRDRAAAAGRMQVLASLAEDRLTKRTGKAMDDTFGIKDSDWSVYRDIVLIHYNFCL